MGRGRRMRMRGGEDKEERRKSWYGNDGHGEEIK